MPETKSFAITYGFILSILLIWGATIALCMINYKDASTPALTAKGILLAGVFTMSMLGAWIMKLLF
jgi:hypothetical protein